MIEYPKIESLFNRDMKTHKFIEGEFKLPEFEYLRENIWIWTEKVNGTNIRVNWDVSPISEINYLRFGGRTDNAQIPTFLFSKLQDLFTIEKFRVLFPEISLTLYGEGYGAKIQKGGGNYISNGVDFVLFDILIGDWWLKRSDVEDIANKLEIECVPIIDEGILEEAICLVKGGFRSHWGDFLAEGLVLKPKVELKARNGHRIITKIKHKDFK